VVTFRSLATLFLPAEPGLRGLIVDAGEDWRFEHSGTEQADAVVWGREPLPSGRGLGAGLAWMAARGRAIRGLRRRPPHGLKLIGIHRIPPARMGSGRIRDRLRKTVRSGALLELWRGPRRRRAIDAALEAAGATDLSAFRPGSGGSALARIRANGGPARIIRLGASGAPADPSSAADALQRLAPLGITCVPRLIGKGEIHGVSWSTETRLPGRTPRALGPRLAAQVGSFCASLPLADGPPTAHRDHFASLSRRFPSHDAALAEARAVCEAAGAAVPAIMSHGDLWSGNLLASGGELSGVVDWDAWHPAAFPGTDLLHAVAQDEGRRLRLGIGGVWDRRPWASERFASVAGPYWRSLGISPEDTLLVAVGLAWWAGQVAWTLRRLPHLAGDDRWVEENVEAVIAGGAFGREC
jgi:hypothetical protein